jgi:flagellar protein FliS
MGNLATSPQAYRRGAVMAATPTQLVVMLYDGARRFLRQAAVAMQAHEIERAHNALRRAELIIANLDGTLDFEQGGEVAERLHSIYLFCLHHLNGARMTQDASRLEEVSTLLGELREAWDQLASPQAEGA